MTADGTIQIRAFAKVNLTLAVLGRRPDGFHELESWVVQVGLWDDLRLAKSPELSLTVDDSAVRSTVAGDGSNLVWRAAEALAKAAGGESGVAIQLVKRIPVGAGLGGGSSDAAATLLGLNRLWGLNWPLERLVPIAAALGSDVPLFMERGSAVIRGRGESVERLAAAWSGWVVLVVPTFGLVTADVYRRWSEEIGKCSPRGDSRPLGDSSSRGDSTARGDSSPWSGLSCDAAGLSGKMFNDLEAAAFSCEPRLAAMHAAIDGLDGKTVRMTGSGSSLFVLVDSEVEAKAWRDSVVDRLGGAVTVYVVPTQQGRD